MLESRATSFSTRPHTVVFGFILDPYLRGYAKVSKEATDLGRKTLIKSYRKAKFSQDEWIGSTTFGSGGVCFPLCYVWLGKGGDKAGTKDFFAASKTKEGREEIFTLKMNQHRNQGAMYEYLKHLGHQCIGGMQPRQWGGDSTAMKAEVAAAIRSPGRFVFGITNPNKTTGHAIAVDTFSNTLFDPNYGVYETTNAEQLIALFNMLLAEYYADLSSSTCWIAWDKFLHLG
jgi:hypothetical protein